MCKVSNSTSYLQKKLDWLSSMCHHKRTLSLEALRHLRAQEDLLEEARRTYHYTLGDLSLWETLEMKTIRENLSVAQRESVALGRQRS